MTTTTRRLAGALTGVLATSLLATPLVVSAPALAQVSPEDRKATAPHVYFPVKGSGVRDLQTSGQRAGTEIKAKCGKAVRAAHPGTAIVSASSKSGPNLVKVVTTRGRITSYYGFMKAALVTTGQIVQAGQKIGKVGKEGDARFCSLYFAVNGNKGTPVNPSRWLSRRVGKPVNTTSLFENWGFVVASFNVLGASHTTNSSRYPTYDVRIPKQAALLDSYAADVVGLQEFQAKQRTAFVGATGATWGFYPDDATLADPTSPFVTGNYAPTENSIIWRNSTMEFVSADYIEVPYFQRIRKMPVVLLRHRATGRTAYFINVHNPASGVGYGDQTANRAAAIAIERAKVVELRATGRPVFLTGDLNDRAAAFCPLTADKLMISPDSIPSYGCATPPSLGIDWVFAAGPARFTRYARDWKPKDLRLTDHPIVWTRAHLAE